MKTFRISFIYKNFVEDESTALRSYKNYGAAYDRAIEYMKEDQDIVSCLIYSNKDTAVVIKRKYADKT